MDECIHGTNPEWCGYCTKVDNAVPVSNVGQYGFHGGRTKQDVLSELCARLAIVDLQVGNGSSLPAELFRQISFRFGLAHGSMPEVGKALADKAGIAWGPECDSTGSVSGGGSTVTLEGLEVMLKAVGKLG